MESVKRDLIFYWVYYVLSKIIDSRWGACSIKADFTFHWVYFYITNLRWGTWSMKKRNCTLKVFTNSYLKCLVPIEVHGIWIRFHPISAWPKHCLLVSYRISSANVMVSVILALKGVTLRCSNVATSATLLQRCNPVCNVVATLQSRMQRCCNVANITSLISNVISDGFAITSVMTHVTLQQPYRSLCNVAKTLAITALMFCNTCFTTLHNSCATAESPLQRCSNVVKISVYDEKWRSMHPYSIKPRPYK